MSTIGYVLAVGGLAALVSGVALLLFDKPVSKDIAKRFADL